ncbi:MAG: hypothetical protein AB1635_00865 [Acidobacteriota bacterium]
MMIVRLLSKAARGSGNRLRKWARRAEKQAQRRWKVTREQCRNGVRRAYTLAVSTWRRLQNVHKPLVRLRRRMERQREIREAGRAEAAVLREVRRLGRTRRTLIVGPWFSEVGFEALYWVPFLRRVAAECSLDPARVVAVSRGGVKSWYRDVAATYVEIFDHIEPGALAARNEERRLNGEGSRKQLRLSALDRELVEYAARQAGVHEYDVLHPSHMYRLFKRYWLGQQSLSFVQLYTRAARQAAPRPDWMRDLPPAYIAVKFYTAASMPDTPGTRAAMRALIAAASRLLPVVLLDTGLVFDDHEDYRFETAHQVLSVRHLMRPNDNLEVQTAVIAGAKAFVATCGSLTWLAPLLGTPTVAVMSDDKFLHPHLYFARQAYRGASAAPFMTVDIRALETLDLGALVATAANQPERTT